MLDICKGKWLLNEFIKILIQEIKNLKVKCELGEIDKCQFCHTGRNELCLYGFEGVYNESQISNVIKKNEGFTEFVYLKNRIANMI